ncbi:Wadjet anti-phage system protein JetD domain-containing protein [Desulfofundulus sp.]|uniref:Wadjet anti-phage system protein JetD domain-containing protein n=1 Tax=Desulfofundulus sp. TaxID=2282750 RepID=UPI003C762EB5
MDYERYILETLVDKYERSALARGKGSSRRIWLHFNPRTIPRYFDDTTARYKEEINGAALALELRGLIEIRWVKFEENNLIEKVALNIDRLGEVYARLKRRSRAEQFRELARLARDYARGAAPWAQEFFHTVARRMEKGESQPYLDPADRGHAEQLFMVIRELSLLQEEIPRRVFSLRVLGNSKAFNNLAPTVARIVRDFHPDWGKDGGGNKATLSAAEVNQALAELGVVDNPQHIFISGNLEFAVEGCTLRVGDFSPDLGLPAEMVDRLTVKNVAADYIITIENLTPFYQFVKTCRDQFLAIYLGGYHNSVRRRFLSKLREYLAGTGRAVPFFHWGDIDYGGFSIFVHLEKRCLPGLKPLYMDVSTLERYRRFASPFATSYGRRLRALLGDPDYRLFHPVIQKMLEEGLRLEQECVEPPSSLCESG